jgi:hypothetical protein
MFLNSSLKKSPTKKDTFATKKNSGGNFEKSVSK